MRCEICGAREFNTIVLLPIKKPDGCLNTIACLSCAEESPAYCRKHERPHLGFADDDTTACVLCIEELIIESEDKLPDIFDEFENNLPAEEYSRLKDWAEVSSDITGNYLSVCLLRALATKALRLKTTIEEIVKQVGQAKSVDSILPRGF